MSELILEEVLSEINFSTKRLCWFSSGRGNFLHSSQHGVVFWICAANTVDNPETFMLLLSSVWTSSRPFLLLALTPSKEAGGAQGAVRGLSWDSWPQSPTGHSLLESLNSASPGFLRISSTLGLCIHFHPL